MILILLLGAIALGLLIAGCCYAINEQSRQWEESE